MSNKVTRKFKSKEWEKRFKGTKDCLWDVEIDYTYDDPVNVGENQNDVIFAINNYWRKITVSQKTTFDFFPSDGVKKTSRKYEVEIWERETNKTTKYKLVEVE